MPTDLVDGRRSAAALLGVAAFAGCTSVLGLAPPTLDPCLDGGGCLDARPDGPFDASDAADARPEASVIHGLRCGGGTFDEHGCNGTTPTCCQETAGGATTYACTATGACTGFSVACSSNANCVSQEICCDEGSEVGCTAASACPSAALVCEPDGGPKQCPTGWTCTAPAVLAGVTSPYWLCTH